MTTIAYGSGLMACDSSWTHGGLQSTSLTKIRRLSSGALIGCAGDNDDRMVIPMLDKIRTPNKLPLPPELAATRCDFEALMAFPGGRLFVIFIGPLDDNHINYEAQVWEANRGFWAAGSGAEVAIGAMAAGKSAREAVAIACKFDNNSKLPVHSVELNPKKKGNV